MNILSNNFPFQQAYEHRYENHHITYRCIYIYDISTWGEFPLTCHDTFQIWTSYPITFHFSKHMRIHAHKTYNCIYRYKHVWTSFLCTNPSQQSCVSPIQQPISQAQIGPSTHIIQWASFPCVNPIQQPIMNINWHMYSTHPAMMCRDLQLSLWLDLSYPSSSWYGIPWTSPLHWRLIPCFSPSVFSLRKKCRKISFCIYTQTDNVVYQIFSTYICIQVRDVAARSYRLMVFDLSMVALVLRSYFLKGKHVRCR